LKGDSASVVAVAVIGVRENAFFIALENVGSTVGARYGCWIRSEWENLETQKQALVGLKPKLVYIIFKNSVRTAKKTPYFTITKINCLTLFKEIIVVYSGNHTKHINTK
jgi:hypothetical protein